MRTVAVSWDPTADRFVASGSHRGQLVVINAPRLPSEPPGPTGFSATELLLAAAGSCTAWDVLEILRKRRHQVDSLSVAVDGEQAPDPPWRYERITLHFAIGGLDLRRSVLERVLRLSCLRYCSVLATVSGVARIEVTLELIDRSGAGDGRQPVSLPPMPAATLVPLEAAETLAVDED